MSEGEEIANKIKELAVIIAEAKTAKKPIGEWKSTLDEMLALKVCSCTAFPLDVMMDRKAPANEFDMCIDLKSSMCF